MSVVIRNPRGDNPRKPWTVRYWVDGRKREKSFATKAEAAAFRTDQDHAARYGTGIDDRAGRQLFGDACSTWIARLACSPRTAVTYGEVYGKHVEPVLGGRTLAAVAGDRDAVAGLLTSGALGGLSISKRRAARRIVVGTLDEAVAAGKIRSHRCEGIGLADNSTANGHGDFIFPSYAQVEQVARSAGIAVWLMRGCGLRISEALAVELADFREGGQVLRVSGQADRDGRGKIPLKFRRAGEYRDVPVPSWLWAKVGSLPTSGPLCPGRDRLYTPYRTALNSFSREAARAGIPRGFTPHSLRHAYASALLGQLVPITDVAAWMGHRSIDVTYKTYMHLIPSASARAVAALDQEFRTWQAEN